MRQKHRLAAFRRRRDRGVNHSSGLCPDPKQTGNLCTHGMMLDPDELPRKSTILFFFVCFFKSFDRDSYLQPGPKTTAFQETGAVRGAVYTGEEGAGRCLFRERGCGVTPSSTPGRRKALSRMRPPSAAKPAGPGVRTKEEASGRPVKQGPQHRCVDEKMGVMESDLAG